MGPREPAAVTLDGRLSLDQLLWVANTRHGPAGHWHARPPAGAADHDHLLDPADARAYLAAHRVPVPDGVPDAAATAGLSAVRAGVDALVGPDPEAWRVPVTPLLASACFRMGADGRILAGGEGWPGFVADLLPPLVALAGRRERLGRCGNPGCRLTFLDDTRSHTRRWCDNGGCGNRVRVRRARDRQTNAARGGLATAGQPPR
jgi:hypothetical protein